MASNADNYFCRGCGLIMEKSWTGVEQLTARLRRKVTAGVTENITLDIENKVVGRICDDSKFKTSYTSVIQDTCTQIIDKNAHVIASAFAGNQPNLADFYAVSMEVCGDKMNLCDPVEDAVFQQLVDGDECMLCLTVVEDFKAVITRSKGGEGYLSRKHVWGLFDDFCSMIIARYPKAAGSAVQEMCEDLLGDYEEDIADAFLEANDNVGKAICGRSAAAKCSKRKGSWRGIVSPLHQLPGSSAKDAEL